MRMLLPIYFFFASHLWVWEFLSTFVPTIKQWCHSSVGRAKDWKSLCPRFDSWWHHEERLRFLPESFFRQEESLYWHSRLSRKTWGKEFHKRCLYTIFSPQTFTMADANVYDGGCKRLRWRLQTFAMADANDCGKRGSALQGRMQCTAGTVAVHCGSGCSALRLRWVKLTPKSPVLFYKVCV